ncbi:MAG: bifunctional DNA-formamidopyrimidine glycosylase/DNA-(apurinic or apyrimidinic site) lyase [Holosporales bacterium]|jgi:formamidopyrimidine-DNA glycosylase|nr:bifunctional DNA-formamidopyrimidine glycosylase/DNA-(apurinic or apyrimidinic site) lyase [Holosporales bacterium]
MPELPEIEILKLQLQKIALDHTVYDIEILVDKLRKPVPKTLKTDILNRKINSIERRGKFLLFNLSNDNILAIHLGMTGQLLVAPNSGKNTALSEKHLRVVFRLGSFAIKFFDTRKFGLIDIFHQNPEYITSLGIDPLSNEFDAKRLFSLTRNNNVTIKSLLLNQKKISGIGNIYANDALFYAGINPMRSSATITQEESGKLAQSIKSVLCNAISLGGTSMKDYIHLDGKKGRYQDHFLVYSKSGLSCSKCGCVILKKKIDGRSSFFCKNCQQ